MILIFRFFKTDFGLLTLLKQESAGLQVGTYLISWIEIYHPLSHRYFRLKTSGLTFP